MTLWLHDIMIVALIMTQQYMEYYNFAEEKTLN